MTAEALTETDTPRMQVRHVSKSFAGVHALTDVSLDIRAGEVLSLLGENGAGKSTLLRILTGDHAPDRGGTLSLDGVPRTFHGPGVARALGVRVIAQEPEIIQDVSVAENVYVGALPARGHRFSRQRLNELVRADLERYSFDQVISPDLLGRQLSPAQRQIVEILRALTSAPTVIAFDEPTSSLTGGEVDALFTLIRRLRDEGVAILYVSHRMHEIFELADRAAVLRDGKLVAVKALAETTETELVRLMVGRELAALFDYSRKQAGEVVLQVDGLTNELVHDVSFSLRAGEVLGLAGLIGAGRSELARTIVGDLPHTAGTIAIDGRPVSIRSPRDAVRAGIGMAPEERKAQALLLRRSVRDNTSLAVLDRLTRFHVVDRVRERSLVVEQTRRMRVRTPSLEQEIRKLSGGNQQKIVLARWLAVRPKVLILDEPTRGVDVGAKSEIYTIISELAAAGMAILVISSEMPEVLGLADRILVMRAGRLSGELTRADANEEKVLGLALPDHQMSAVVAAESEPAREL